MSDYPMSDYPKIIVADGGVKVRVETEEEELRWRHAASARRTAERDEAATRESFSFFVGEQ